MEAPISELRAMRILVVDDEESIRFAISMYLENDGHKVATAATIDDALQQTAKCAFDLIFLDIRLGAHNGLDYIKPLLDDNPSARIIVITAYASIETAVEAMKRGAADYLSKPFEASHLLHLTQKVAERRLLERNVEALQRTLGAMDPEADFLTSSRIYRESIEFARRIATANAPVLIQGETGTGRGRLARAIHQWSPRSDSVFASFTFDGQSMDAMEAELFGSAPETGGVTGAIAFCHGGTLLLDEISNMPMRLQDKLLTVIRDKQFERQDQLSRRPVNVRIIATTQVDLRRAVETGSFRADLLLALNVAQVDLPCLRERPEDIVLLAERYLAHLNREHQKRISGFSRDAIFTLKTHRWPGNSRELKNVVERAVLACDSDQIGLEHLPANLMNVIAQKHDAAAGSCQVGDLVSLELIEETHIQKVLASVKTLRRAAAVLGVNASALCRRLKRMRNEAQDDKLAE
jgi:NtrC-family two-component system response regulator AlgB